MRLGRQAEAEYPAECCGVLVAVPGEAALRVHPCRNVQGMLHAQDPVQYPRDARRAYNIDPGELYRVLSATDAEGSEVAGVYHSHVDVEAYFSAEDRERALALLGEEPAYPDVMHLVVSVRDRRFRNYRCFAWDAARRDFVEVALEVVE